MVVVAVGAGLVADPGVTGDPDLLGRLDDATGRSSQLPPLDDLQLLWRRTVDAVGILPSGAGAAVAVRTPPRLVELTDGALVGDEFIDLAGPAHPLRLPAGAASDADGELLAVDATDVVRLAAATGAVLGRVELRGATTWRPVGVARGWTAGAGVFTDAEGVLGAVERDGRVRWVGEPDWTWHGVGDGTDWLVVTRPQGALERVLVVDGRTGQVHRDVGPTGVVHAPVVHGDTLAWVDPYAGIDRGLGHPVEVHGLRLDGSGRIWTVTDLPSTSGAPEAVRLTTTDDSVVVSYWSVGQATTAVWLAPSDGTQLGAATVVGTGRTGEGWPVTEVAGDAVAHVDPVRREVRVVDRRGRVRWSIPSLPGEGLVADGGLVLVRTPPRGTSLQSRLRLLDARTGRTRWEVVTTDTQAQRLVGVLADHVGMGPTGSPGLVSDQSWLHLDTGRRRAGTGLAAQVLGVDAGELDDLTLLGRVQVGGRSRPVFTRADGSVVGPADEGGRPSVAALLAAPGGTGAVATSATLVDADVGIDIHLATLVARDPIGGRQLWRTTSTAALRADLAVLLPDLLVVVGADGLPRAWDRQDGTPRWVAGVTGVTAITAGGHEVVIGTADGQVVVLDADGSVLQRVRVGRDAVEDVAVIGGRVVAAVGGDAVGLGRGATFVEPGDRVVVP